MKKERERAGKHTYKQIPADEVRSYSIESYHERRSLLHVSLDYM